jgi:hypothetical protein
MVASPSQQRDHRPRSMLDSPRCFRFISKQYWSGSREHLSIQMLRKHWLNCTRKEFFAATPPRMQSAMADETRNLATTKCTFHTARGSHPKFALPQAPPPTQAYGQPCHAIHARFQAQGPSHRSYHTPATHATAPDPKIRSYQIYLFPPAGPLSHQTRFAILRISFSSDEIMTAHQQQHSIGLFSARIR